MIHAPKALQTINYNLKQSCMLWNTPNGSYVALLTAPSAKTLLNIVPSKQRPSLNDIKNMGFKPSQIKLSNKTKPSKKGNQLIAYIYLINTKRQRLQTNLVLISLMCHLLYQPIALTYLINTKRQRMQTNLILISLICHLHNLKILP